MTSPGISSTEFGNDAGAPAGAIEALLGRPVLRIDAVRAGANNRVWRVVTGTGTVAVKVYPVVAGDRRDRRATEAAALRFLAAKAESAVPALIATDAVAGLSALSWLPGERPEADAAAIDAALGFVERLRDNAADAAAGGLPDASEACFGAGDLLTQIDARIGRLTAVAAPGSPLAALLEERIGPRFRQAGPAAAPFETPLPAALRTLSPSDFGFHNAVRSADGRTSFLDFEYFGWDDPVKLAADFLLHPGMSLPVAARRWFARGIRPLFAHDGGFEARLRALLPLYAVRWSLILLNEFLPERLSRRRAAGIDDPLADLLARQLDKALEMIELGARIVPEVLDER